MDVKDRIDELLKENAILECDNRTLQEENKGYIAIINSDKRMKKLLGDSLIYEGKQKSRLRRDYGKKKKARGKK